MDALECIHTRRSVRKFTEEPVSREHIMEILDAGRWAPSGQNNQPWRFVIVSSDGSREGLSGLTKYGNIIKSAPVSIAVFIDRDSMYNDTKDHQSIGACLQNMLLAAHAVGLGAVWLGEILKSAEKVRQLLGLDDNLELMAVLAVGHPASSKHVSQRMELDELLIKDV